MTCYYNITKLIFLKKKLKPVLVRSGFLGQKLVQTGLVWFFQFGSVLLSV